MQSAPVLSSDRCHTDAPAGIAYCELRLNTNKAALVIMGMPVITPSTTTRSQAITDIIESVALQETALSHILNAEGEKIQKMVAMQDVSPDVLLATNKSVESMVNAVSRLEMILHSKLSAFDGCLCQPDDAAAPEV